MLRYIARLGIISTLQMLAITILAFTVIHLAPGEPIVLQQDLQARATGAQRESLRQLFELDKPLYVQYWRCLLYTSPSPRD